MNLNEKKHFCNQWLAAWTGNRPDYLITFYHSEAYYQDPGRVKGLKGHQELLSYFKKLLAKNPDWKWECVELIPTEKGFTLKWLAHIPGVSSAINGVDIVELDDNKITRNEVYFDTGLLRPSL